MKHFCSVHNHDFSSILDGVASVKEIARVAKERGLSSVALTNHGNISSSYEQFIEFNKVGLKPIFGCEFYIQHEIKEKDEEQEIEDEEDNSDNAETEEDAKEKKDTAKLERKNYHQIVLVKNEEGWRNICKLNYYSFLKKQDKSYDEFKGGFYYRPRIRRSFLFEAKQGLITTSTCMASEINRFILSGEIDKGYQLMELYKKEFGDDFYAELQLNEIDEIDASQKVVNKNILEFASALNIKCILTSDAHYVNKEDAELQDISIAIARKSTIYDPNAFKLHARNLYLHSRHDFYHLSEEFGFNYKQEQIDEWLDNTLEIEEKCNFGFKKTKNTPVFFEDPNDSKKLLLELCKTALKEYIVKQKFDTVTALKYTDRFKYELSVISKNGYIDYFLIVWDIMKFCRDNDLKTGIGRGSVGSSLIAFLLQICGLDPIKYNLFFERFVNPEALSEPDIDLDFDSERREEVIDYIKSKYGEESVIRIGNYNTFHIRGCFRDLVRSLNGSKEDIDFICSDQGAAIPDDLTNETVDAWFHTFEEQTDAKSKRIWQWYLDNPDVIKWFKKMYGEVRHLSQHAAGVLITPGPVWHFIPVNRTGNTLVSGYPESSAHKNLSALGLLKLDILGLETVTQIRKTVELIKERGTSQTIDEEVYNIDLENPELYKEFAKGDNFLIFQFEGPGISETVRRAQPKTFEEVAAINSLHRPAALIAGGTAKFIKVCSGQTEAEKIHPIIDDILAPTKGVIAFQEQVSRLIHVSTGISLGVAELMRKEIMDKKNKYLKELQQFEETFVDLVMKNGVNKEKAEYIKEFITKNSGYSFNASHSFSYAYLAMQTLWLKMKYPEEFYSVALTSNGNEKMFAAYITDAMKRGLEISPPSIFHSKLNFVPVGAKKIVCGLKVIKGIGPKAYEEFIHSPRNWTTFTEFLLHPWSKFNRASMEAIILCGGVKDLEPNTKLAFEVMQYHYQNRGNLNKTNRKKEIKYSVEMLEAYYKQLKNSNIKDFTEREMDKHWKNSTSFSYPFRNKFLKFAQDFSEYGVVPATSWDIVYPLVYGEIAELEVLKTKTNKPYYKITLADGFGEVKCKIWDNQMRDTKDMDKMQEGSLVCIEMVKTNFGFDFAKNGRFLLIEN